MRHVACESEAGGTRCSSGGGTGCRHVAHPVAGAIPQDEAAPGLNQAGVRTSDKCHGGSRGRGEMARTCGTGRLTRCRHVAEICEEGMPAR